MRGAPYDGNEVLQIRQAVAKGSFTNNIRADILFGGVGLEVFKKRPDINCFSKFAEKLGADIFSGGGSVVTRLTR